MSNSHNRQIFIISGIKECAAEMRDHLYSLGFLPGKTIELLQVCPLGDPMVVRVMNKQWAMPKSMWEHLELIEKESPA